MSYGGTLTSGIQDISALLPLLGTEQCEEHAGSALSDGFLFAAATPLSIFGSLGLARAGFKAAFASIGAKKLRDAGFKPSGKNLALIMMDPANRDRYLIETRLCERLKDLHFENKGSIPAFFNKGLGWWNLKMLLATSVCCMANLMAYIELIFHNGNHVPLRLRLLFPITRIVASSLTVVSLQILIQLRIARFICAPALARLALSLLYRTVESLFIWTTLLGSLGCVVGYIGCFSIVQGYRGSLRGPLIWIAAETTLSIIRILIWSLNPACDDAPPLRLIRAGTNSTLSWREPFVNFVTQREPLPEVEINGLDLKVQRAHQFLQSLRHHSAIFVRPLAFPDSSLLYSLTERRQGGDLVLYIVIVDHVDQTTRVYSEENGVPTFRMATFSVSNVEAAVLSQPELDQVRVTSAMVGRLIPDEARDHVTSNEDLRAALTDHYRSIQRASAGDLSMQRASRRDTVSLNWELTSRLDEAPQRPPPHLGLGIDNFQKLLISILCSL